MIREKARPACDGWSEPDGEWDLPFLPSPERRDALVSTNELSRHPAKPRSGEIYVAQRVSAGKLKGDVTSRGAAAPRCNTAFHAAASAAAAGFSFASLGMTENPADRPSRALST